MRSLRGARAEAETSVRNAHQGKQPWFGEPVFKGGSVVVPYSVGTESGVSECPLDEDFGPCQVFTEDK